jgi:O-glycosyl hydrolase
MSSHGFGRRQFLTTAIGVVAAWTQVSGNAAAATSSRNSSVQVWLTDISARKWVVGQSDVPFRTKNTDNPLTIKIDDSVKYQKIQGFGAAMTDSSAWLINKLSTADRAKLMQKLYDPSKGIGLSLIRTPMGATDFNASGNYSYDDMPAGQTDPTLSVFSVRHDEKYIIPVLRQALAQNPSAKILANPWSPPGWMKTSDSMIGGTLKSDYASTLADYFVKFIKAYDKAGVPISFITPQNEPMGTPSWPGMFLSAYQESAVIQEIGQAFSANRISTKILAWDHNWDVPSYPETIFSDPAASQYTAGTGWHIYSGNPTYQTLVHNDYPGKETYITEASGGVWQGDDETAFNDALGTWIIKGMRNWANGVMLWNTALDPKLGPLNSDTNGIPMCRGLVTVDPDSGQVSYNVDYYALAHASRFVKPGAHRIYSNTFGEGSIESVAFLNPDGSKVVIAYNSGSAAKNFSVADGTQSFDYTLNAGDAVTFTYTGGRSGGTPAATNVFDPTHDFTFKSSLGPMTVTYDPALLQYQNAVRTGSKLLTYSLPMGASIKTPGTSLSRGKWTATASSSPDWGAASNALDGDINSRWNLGQGTTSGAWFQVDLGSPTSFNKIVFATGESNSFDYVTKYQIYVSDDGAEWGSAVANGSGNIGKTAVTLPEQTARYIRIVCVAASGFWWSIAEINVYGSSGGTGSIAAPTAVPKGLQLKTWTSPEGEQVTAVFNGTASSRSFPVSADGSYTYTLPSGTSAMFTTQKLSSFPAPVFGSLKPKQGIPRAKFTISGSHFGDAQGLGTVRFGKLFAEIDTWSDTSISAYVPSGLAVGTYKVAVNGAGGADAGSASFDVIDLGPALSRTGWTATTSDTSPYNDGPANMLDGDSGTRYSSGRGQYDGLWIQVDMQQTQTFDKILLDVGSNTGDYARSADVYVSTNATDWTKVSSIEEGQPVELISFPTQTARYIKIVNTGNVASNWWSIAELTVYS